MAGKEPSHEVMAEARCLEFSRSGVSREARAVCTEEIVVIAHPALPKADRPTLLRLYTGRTVSIGMQSVTPLNLSAGNPLREKFLKDCLEQTEEQYTGYWLVRRYVGKGAPPPELSSVDEVLRYVQDNPGAMGYVPLSRLPRNANVVFRC